MNNIADNVYLGFVYNCCPICYRKANITHFIDKVEDRNNIAEILGKEAIRLCSEHHHELHTIGQQAFFEKYHLNGGVKIDKTICKIYGLKGK